MKHCLKHCNYPYEEFCPLCHLKAQPPIAGSAICSADSWKGLDWPNPKARFEIWDDGDPHGQLAIVLPGGQLMVCSGHADLETDLRRAKWICDALNEKRDKENPPNDQAEL
jgi:hypothetical protein